VADTRTELLDKIRADRVGWHVEKRLDDYHYQHYKNGKKYEFATTLVPSSLKDGEEVIVARRLRQFFIEEGRRATSL
jgi:hypothetical protein